MKELTIEDFIKETRYYYSFHMGLVNYELKIYNLATPKIFRCCIYKKFSLKRKLLVKEAICSSRSECLDFFNEFIMAKSPQLKENK